MMEDNTIRTATETREVGMADKVRVEDSGGQVLWRIFRTAGMDKEAEEMWGGNKRDVRQQRWRNGLQGRRRTGKILTGNNGQSEGGSLLQDNGDGRKYQR